MTVMAARMSLQAKGHVAVAKSLRARLGATAPANVEAAPPRPRESERKPTARRATDRDRIWDDEEEEAQEKEIWNSIADLA